MATILLCIFIVSFLAPMVFTEHDIHGARQKREASYLIPFPRVGRPDVKYTMDRDGIDLHNYLAAMLAQGLNDAKSKRMPRYLIPFPRIGRAGEYSEGRDKYGTNEKRENDPMNTPKIPTDSNNLAGKRYTEVSSQWPYGELTEGLNGAKSKRMPGYLIPFPRIGRSEKTCNTTCEGLNCPPRKTAGTHLAGKRFTEVSIPWPSYGELTDQPNSEDYYDRDIGMVVDD